MIKTTVKDIISGIIAKRDARGLTAQQIADLSGVSKSTVDRLLRNEEGTGISAQNLFDIANAVGYKVGESNNEDPAIQRIVDMYEARIRQTEIQHNLSQARQNRWMIGVSIFAAVIVLFVLAMLFLDMANPNVGWVRG